MISIITATLNRKDLVEQMYEGLKAAGTQDYELILVDNGDDGTDAWAREQGIHVIKPEHPLTFAESNNIAVKEAQGEYLLLLNNDTIPLPGFLDAMMAGFAKGHIIGAKLLYPNELVQHAGVGFTNDGYPQHLWRWASREDQAVCHDAFVPAVTFACALIPMEMWRVLGGLNEQYVNGFEDIDFVLRAKELGAQAVYVANAELYHLESQTAGRKDNDKANTQQFKEQWVDTGRVHQVLGVWPIRAGVYA